MMLLITVPLKGEDIKGFLLMARQKAPNSVTTTRNKGSGKFKGQRVWHLYVLVITDKEKAETSLRQSLYQ